MFLNGKKTACKSRKLIKVNDCSMSLCKKTRFDLQPEEDLTCPVCYEIFKDPVFLSCSHNLCKLCLQQFWKGMNTQDCPICRRRSSKDNPPCNLALKNLCEAFLQKRIQTTSVSEEFCSLHNEKIKLYCLDDKELACMVCRDSQKHVNHTFRPINEIVSSYKDELTAALKSLKEKLKRDEEMKVEYDNTIHHIKNQSQRTKKHIKEEFTKLHQFLRDEEEATLIALRQEEDKKSRMMKEKLEKINREISALSDTIKDTEEKMKANDILLLRNFKAVMQRVQISPPSSEMVSGALINMADFLGNLAFRVWKKMKRHVQHTPVILDPNTTYPKFTLSDDLTSLTYSGVWQCCPYNPERSTEFPSVLGSEGFNSGTHWWDVEVGDNSDWVLGLTTASNPRTREFFQNNVWCLWHRDNKYFSQSPGKSKAPFTVKEKLRRVRVQLDCDQGRVSFCDPVTNKCLHELTATFTEMVFPFFDSYDKTSPLKMLPSKVFVTTGKTRL